MKEVHKLFNPRLDIDHQKLLKELPELKEGESLLKSLVALVKPKVFWSEMPIKKLEKARVFFENGFVINSAYIATGIKNCHKATLLAATIDKELPEYSSRALNKGELWKGTIADILGSYLIEILVDNFHKYLIRNYLSKGLFSTARFSPGYGDWALEEQNKIIPFLETEPFIRVNSNHLLQPVKSITALIGWSKLSQDMSYPKGERKKGFCQGSQNCAHCQTWACKK